MAVKDCPKCGQKIHRTAVQCIYCGWGSVEQPATYCPECGHLVRSSAKTCPYCGLNLADAPPDGDRGSEAERREAQLALQLRLAEIDLEWERARQTLMVRASAFGSRQRVPTRARAWSCVTFMTIFAVVLGAGFVRVDPDPRLGVFKGGFYAAILLAGGLLAGWCLHRKAVAYERAEAEYMRRKAVARARSRSDAGSKPLI